MDLSFASAQTFGGLSGSHSYAGPITVDGNGMVIFGNTDFRSQVDDKNRDKEYEEERRRIQCHQAFKTCNYEAYKDVNPLRVAGTCTWVFEHPHFSQWQANEQDSLLWISADPGCGKSVFSKSLVDELAGQQNLTICYFFFKDNEDQDNVNVAFCSILHQLFTRQPQLAHYAVPAFSRNAKRLLADSDELWRIFLAATRASTQQVVCVFDALDECREQDRAQLIGRLCDLHKSAARPESSSIKVLVTSRPYDSVQRHFGILPFRIPQIRLRGEDENDKIGNEINLVIRSKIEELSLELGLSEDVCERLRSRLESMQHRTYLWLHLAIDGIRRNFQYSLNPAAVEILDLPANVEEAYEGLLQRIDSRVEHQVRKILLIILAARRPLSTHEMAIALGISIQSREHGSLAQVIDADHLGKQICQWCGLFVFINHSKLFLIHQTAKEFLLSSTQVNIAGRYKASFAPRAVEAEMARICISYLCSDFSAMKGAARGRPRGKRLAGHEKDFFTYCAQHWSTHFQEDEAWDNNIWEKVILLYTTEGMPFKRWIQIFLLSDGSFPYHILTGDVHNVKSEVVKTGQHAASYSGHTAVLKRLDENNALDWQAEKKGRDSMLHWAALGGRENTIKWLILRYSTLQATWMRDEPSIFQSRLDFYTENDIDHAFRAAVSVRQLHVLEILMQSMSRSERIHELKTWALLLAASSNDVPMLEAIFDLGALPDKETLLIASSQHNPDIVRLLVDRGVDVNGRGILSGKTALHVALSDMSHGDISKRARVEEVVKILVDAKADVDAYHSEGTPHFLALKHGYVEAARILLAASAPRA